MAKYKCKVCGYIHEGNKAPDVCPVCGVPASEFEEIKEAAAGKKGLDRDSNVYTVVYASVMVVLVAVVLAFTSQSLRLSSRRTKITTKDSRFCVQSMYLFSLMKLKQNTAN